MKRLVNCFIRIIWYKLGLRSWIQDDEKYCDLAGDRAIEDSWCLLYIREGDKKVLDIGCVQSPLTLSAQRFGNKVDCVDLRSIEYEMAGIKFYQSDILKLNLKEKTYDIILLCSTVEHIGIEGRYGSSQIEHGDLKVMELCKRLLAPKGKLIVTIPVGIDDVYYPNHRIYGEARLPKLLLGYEVKKKEFWRKNEKNRWVEVAEEVALNVKGSNSYYAMGLYELICPD